MSTDPTARSGSFAGLGPVIEALVYLQATYPHLPAPYITAYSTGAAVDLALDAPAEFEEWRVALQIPPHSVELHAFGGHVWLTADTTVRGVPVHLAGDEIPLTAEQARTPQPRPEDPALPGATEAIEPAGGAR
ncbi:hypothetical protein [Streptomyces sp. C10-9-1]|uniref:hypothetical protein n=1 Tax=Streptomyces sp. C10-9-1 TaxID=1859285 RepID=UPI003D760E80